MRYLFENYSLDADGRELRRGAEVVPMAPQAFDFLFYLIRNRDRVVGSDDLDRWGDFQTKLLGAQPHGDVGPAGRRFILFQDLTPCCHHGAMLSPEPL